MHLRNVLGLSGEAPLSLRLSLRSSVPLSADLMHVKELEWKGAELVAGLIMLMVLTGFGYLIVLRLEANTNQKLQSLITMELALSLEKLTNEKLLNPHEMQDRTKHKQRFDAKIALAVADQTRLPFVTAENQFEARSDVESFGGQPGSDKPESALFSLIL
ncbi:hypothetical protein Tco_0675992 [Tanacetum coccineum]